MQTHPVLAGAHEIATVLDSLAEVNPTYMTTTEKKQALLELAALESRVAELRLRIMATADDVALETGARDAGTWLAARTGQRPEVGRAQAELAEALDKRWTHLAVGMRTSGVNPAQAQAIARVLARLVDEVAPKVALDPRQIVAAEQHLVAKAAEFGPAQLRVLGERILTVVAPELAEAAEAALLAEQEAEASTKASLDFRRLGDGTTRLTARLADLDASRLRTFIESFTSPRHPSQQAGTREEDRIPASRKRAFAFAALLEHLDPAGLPMHGGDATTLMVTLDYDQLRRDLALGELTDGTTISPAEARRLACTAKILPAVLDGRSEVLDLGRAQRLFSPAQRKAIRLRDRRCRAHGCDIRPEWCEVHHLKPWHRGGATDIANGILLCSWHHHRADDPAYITEHLPDGDLTFTKKR